MYIPHVSTGHDTKEHVHVVLWKYTLISQTRLYNTSKLSITYSRILLSFPQNYPRMFYAYTIHTSCRHHIYSLSLSLSPKLNLKDWKKHTIPFHSIYSRYLIQHLPHPTPPYPTLFQRPFIEEARRNQKKKIHHEMIRYGHMDR